MNIEKDMKSFEAVAVQLDLLRELNDVKRLYSFNLGTHSFASLIFLNAVKALHTSDSLDADVWCAAIVSSARLGAITPSVMQGVGLKLADAQLVINSSILLHDSLSAGLKESLTNASVSLVSTCIEDTPLVPDWALRLALSPRAGATCPGKPRIVLEPPEQHSDHCIMVAVYGYLLADTFGASREDAWLMGLCHHLHNADLPDAGFTGEMLLGTHLGGVIATLRNRIIDSFSDHYRNRVVGLFEQIEDLNSPLAQTFHAADTIDRIVQMEHYERAARFRVSTALEEFNLVHEGQAQQFQHALLSAIGLSYKSAS